MLFNWIPLIGMLMFPLAITIVAIMAKMAILVVLAMALDLINMATWGIQLKSRKKN